MARSFLNSAHTVSIGARSPLLGGKLTDTKPAFLYSLGAWMNFSLSCHIFSFLTPAPYCLKHMATQKCSVITWGPWTKMPPINFGSRIFVPSLFAVSLTEAKGYLPCSFFFFHWWSIFGGYLHVSFLNCSGIIVFGILGAPLENISIIPLFFKKKCFTSRKREVGKEK